jgi:hypothetical protein
MFNRPTAQPTLIGYLGNFNGDMGQPESEPCKRTFAVREFGKGSHKLSGPQKKHIKDIAARIVSLVKRDLGEAPAHLRYHFEGHVDKKTDPAQHGNLDERRAIEVSGELQDQVIRRWKKGSLLQTPTISRAGSSRPFGSDPKRNRRVVICVRWGIQSP